LYAVSCVGNRKVSDIGKEHNFGKVCRGYLLKEKRGEGSWLAHQTASFDRRAWSVWKQAGQRGYEEQRQIGVFLIVEEGAVDMSHW